MLGMVGIESIGSLMRAGSKPALSNGVYLQTRIAISGQISPQTAQPVHPPLSSQTTKKYPCRLISSPNRISSFGQEIVQRLHPLQRSRSISILAIIHYLQR